ncbi:MULTISPECIES: hypothetical protein [Rhizobium/Agrobacterium group]|uniref:Uncharacterized protein n=6 Tax=Rhizobium/Agrobacterium group TaxID=227290 RepID=A0A2Z2PH60_AGRFC|nr:MULTISPECIES: hypothetical protein [Rhizobium/Agrobacterium group]OCJ08340.1 hypothetical protein A6U88_24845 [Agrobacterium sp. B131/95]ASK42230.1 hypothetical protein [Agrobacterium sp.]ASK42584.1 hypothetical protein [Agrobacterium fabrum str. C58]ASK44337.1 hypothetical protein [Rhizobium rhizogenes]ASK45321.1 hypothetical protein [Agrobacterium tumefaciens]
MSVTVTSANFSGRFTALNGTKTLPATHADIIRSLLTVGYPSRRAAVRTVGPWREKMLVAMATGYLDASLNTTAYFRSLEQSEKVGVSFLFGEAFTHWYAQSQMSVQYLVHVAGLASCRWGSPTAPVAPKAGAAPPPPKSRPDFIGIKRRERHVFESKGRIRAPAASTVAKALGQVSALHTVNGRAPTTRCANFFMFKAGGAEGRVLDPPAKGDGITVTFDLFEAITRAYSIILDQPVLDLSDQVGAGYVGREIDDGVFLGIDKEILALVRERPPTEATRRRRVAQVFSALEDRSQNYAGRQDRSVSSGLDGVLLLDRRSPRALRRFRTQG